MVWRRLRVPGSCTLRELHGVIQVAMGWEGFHLYQFCLRARRLGSWELAASSPDVTLAALRLRRGARFTYEYDLNIPWRHELRVEDHLAAEPAVTYPVCTDGDGACPPEDCGGPERYLAGLDEVTSPDALNDLGTMAEILRAAVLERRPEVLDDEETRWRLEDAVERSLGPRAGQGTAVLAALGQRPPAQRRTPGTHASAGLTRSARRRASRSTATIQLPHPIHFGAKVSRTALALRRSIGQIQAPEAR